MNKILLDTHIILFSFMRSTELKEKTKSIITEYQQNNAMLISSISLWEIAMLASKNRINIFRPINDFLKHIIQSEGIEVIEISPDIASESVMLQNFHKDPCDRIIVATSRVTSSTLITRDKEIIAWARHGHVKYMEG